MNLGKQVYEGRLHGLSPAWVQRRLGYGSFVAGDESFVFLETPKAACSTLKWVVTHLDGRQISPRHVGRETSDRMCIHYRHITRMKSLAHLSDTAFDRILDRPDVVRFCAVRNPYSRLLSAWSSKVRVQEPGFAWVWDKVAEYSGADPAKCPSFDDFVRWICRTNDPAAANPHWQPMTLQLLPDLLQYTHILHTESLQADLDGVLRDCGRQASAAQLLQQFATNESLPVAWRDYYDDNLAGDVARYYAEDFERFGYDTESWRKPVESTAQAPTVDEAMERLRRLEQTAVDCIRQRNAVIASLNEQLEELRK